MARPEQAYQPPIVIDGAMYETEEAGNNLPGQLSYKLDKDNQPMIDWRETLSNLSVIPETHLK